MRGEFSPEIVKERLQRERVGNAVIFSADDFGCQFAKRVQRFIRQTRAAEHAD